MATLNEFGAQVASERGKDPADPVIAGAIEQTATELRSMYPGTSDDDIIATHGDAIKAHIAGRNAPAEPEPTAEPTPTAPVAGGPAPVAPPTLASPTAIAPSPELQAVRQRQAEISKKYSPEAEKAIRDKVNKQAAFEEMGRVAGLGFRAAASPSAQAALDQGYKEQQASTQRPLTDWNTDKANAVAELEQLVKSGQATQADARHQIMILGQQQIQKEKADAATELASKNDPNSAHSQAMRAMVQQRFPDFKPANFERATYTMLATQLPGLEKQFEKQVESNDKKLDRESRERTSAKSDSAKIEAARLKASGKGGAGGPPKLADVQRGIIAEQGIEKTETELKTQLNAITRSEKLLAEAEELLPNVTTGPNVGAAMGTWVGQRVASKDRQRIQQIQGDLTNQIAIMAKGAQTEGDVKRYDAIVDMLSKDDPRPGIKAAKEALMADKAKVAQGISASVENRTRLRNAASGESPTGATSKPTVSGW